MSIKIHYVLNEILETQCTYRNEGVAMLLKSIEASGWHAAAGKLIVFPDVPYQERFASYLKDFKCIQFRTRQLDVEAGSAGFRFYNHFISPIFVVLCLHFSPFHFW